MTASGNFQPQKNSGPSFLRLRSPLASLFSFRKSAKQTLKPPPDHERHGIYSISGQLPTNTDGKKKFDIYHSGRSVKQIAGLFEAQQSRARENDSTKASTQLEREVFQVLGDLDQKLAQEQSHKQTLRTSRLSSYKHGRQYGKEDSLHNNTTEPKKVYNSLSSPDGRKNVSLEATHKTYATYQPRNFYEMYSNRQRSASKPETSNKNFYKKSPSVFSSVINTSSSSPSFSSSSLHQSSSSIDLDRTRPHKSRRTPITSIKWSNAFNSGQPVETGRPVRTLSALDLTNLGKSIYHSRVFDLHKYKNTPSVPESTSDDFHQVSNINNITNASSMKSADDRATGYYKTDSIDNGPKVQLSTPSERYWDEEYKENSINGNEMSRTSVENSRNNDMELEPMEVEIDIPVEKNTCVADDLKGETEEASSDLRNLSLQTENLSSKADLINKECKMEVDNEQSDIQNKDVPMDCTFHDPNLLGISSSHISEPEILSVAAPNVFLHSSNMSLSTSVDHGPGAQEDPPQREMPGFTNHNRALNPKMFSSFESKTSYKIDTPPYMEFKSSKTNDRESTLAHKRSSLSSNVRDIGGRFSWMNGRRGSNDNHTSFRSDTLKFQKRNASSLPDLIDQDSDILPSDAEVTFPNRSCGNVVDYDATSVPETKSSRTYNDSRGQYLENNSKYEQPDVQNTTLQPENLGSRISHYLHKPYRSSYSSTVLKKIDQKTTYPTTDPYLTNRQSKGFMSDTLKFKSSSSMPDLIDQDSGEFGNESRTIFKNNCERDGVCHTSTVLETLPSRIPEERKEVYLDSSSRYGRSCLQDIIRQPKKSILTPWQSLQKLSTFSYGTEEDRTLMVTEKKMDVSEVANQADTLNENSKVEKMLNLEETSPFSHVHAQSVNFKRSQYNGQSGSDSNNNNTRPVEGIAASAVYNKNVLQKHPETKEVRVSKPDTFPKPNPTALYRQEAVSWANQKNTVKDLQVKQGSESESNLTQTLTYQLDQEANNRAAEDTEPPKVRDSSSFPDSQTGKDLQKDNLSKATHLPTTEKKSTNLLKQHLFVAPEPYKRNIPIRVIPKPEWNLSTSSGDNQTPSSQEAKPIKDLLYEKLSQDGLHQHKTYTCEQVVKNTEIYEGLTDCSYTEIDKIEYRKVVSVYYSLPRKFSKGTSELSKNNLKNIDKTLEKNRAPTALLDKIGRYYKEEQDTNHQNLENSSTIFTESIHSDKVLSKEAPCKKHHLNFHIIPLETKLMKNGSRPNSGMENDDYVNKFSSLHISENENYYTAKEDPQNENEYSPSRPTPKYSSNTYYYTLPNRKSNLKDLERNVLEGDIAMARDRFNIYPSSRILEPSPPESRDVFASPTFYDNLNHSPCYDFMHLQANNKRDYNSNNNFARDCGGLPQKNSMDEGLFSREDLRSFYKSKSQSKSYSTEDLSPHVESNTSPTSPQTDYNSSVFTKNNDLNRPRPSYCSEFVQKKMKPINKKKFTFSFDNSSQESVNPKQTGSYGETVQTSDADSPSVTYYPKDSYSSHVSKHFGQGSPKHSQNDPYSNLYRSKSMKFLNTEGQENIMDYNRKSDGSFSSKSCGGTLRGKSPFTTSAWNRRFSDNVLDENDNWPVSEETSERKPVFTSKSLDYGIFGKEQQEAILNNVKRSLTEGRLWRPSFLKYPGFLRTEECCSSQEINPVGRSPDDVSSQGPNFKKPLNIYEDEPVVSSDSDTDTTTDDEYYLDENDKESEL
ncbi:exophilin-5 isoform X2 [Hyla sarda]|nr:exophilin-5 isoform X2 [Hyla sarda]